MKKMKYSIALTFLLLTPGVYAQSNDEIIRIDNGRGVQLAYTEGTGVNVLAVDGLKFKDLNKNGKLDNYEDWRLPVEERARNLASQMSKEQIAGLMLYSAQEWIEDSNLTKIHENAIGKNNLRHILVGKVKNTKVAVQWSNNIQSYAESMALGIPCNNSTDPRHTIDGSDGINGGAGGNISYWPDGLGMAATFDAELVRNFGQIAAKEYRALGLTTALSPQVDLGTEPRWFRITATFGEDARLSADMGRAFIDGFQTSYGKDEIKDGWGYGSVNCMVKHWPGGGPVESGRDAHFSFGKYAVYPGDNFEVHLIPFTEGAFKLEGPTKKASAVMPYYTISYNQDELYGENVGNSFSKYIITDLLRNKYNYEGVVCTDWGITSGKKWGVEKLSTTERFYKILLAGVDQIGGVNDPKRLLEAFQIGESEYGEKWIRERIELSAIRLLCNMFRVGLFENPYLDVEKSAKTVANSEFVQAGYKAQVKSVVMLKNKNNILPVKSNKVIYIPKILTPAGRDPMGKAIHEKFDYPLDMELAKQYFTITDDPEKADLALVFVKGPIVGLGFERGGREFVPISLQYSPYKAVDARNPSIAPDNMDDPIRTNRTYQGETIETSNYTDLKTILDTKIAMKDKPVIVSMSLTNPSVVAEFESKIDGLLVSFGVQEQPLLDIISGKAQPSALLPVQMPANMQTVEYQKEDVSFDMNCHIDTEGNKYDFGFGLNWFGVINDHRTTKYKR